MFVDIEKQFTMVFQKLDVRRKSEELDQERHHRG